MAKYTDKQKAAVLARVSEIGVAEAAKEAERRCCWQTL